MISTHGLIKDNTNDKSICQTVTMLNQYGGGTVEMVFEQSSWSDGAVSITMKSDGLKASVSVHDVAITALINALCRVREWAPKPEEKKEEENADA
jgi:hypothetical protein